MVEQPLSAKARDDWAPDDLHVWMIPPVAFLYLVLCLGLLLLSQGLVAEDIGVSVAYPLIEQNLVLAFVAVLPVMIMLAYASENRLRSGDFSRLAGLLPAGLSVAILILTAASFALPEDDARAAAQIHRYQNVLAFGVLLVAASFVWVTKRYRLLAGAFAVATVLVGLVLILSPFNGSVSGALPGVNIMLMLVFSGLLGWILSEHRAVAVFDRESVRILFAQWPVAVGWFGLVVALWIDVWMADRSCLEARALALSSLLPSLLLFAIRGRRGFVSAYRDFYESARESSTYAMIERGQQRIWQAVLAAGRQLLVLQLAVSLCALVAAPFLLQWLGIGVEHLGVFRFSLLGTFFTLFTLIALALLACMRQFSAVLLTGAVFLLSGLALSAVGLQLGVRWQGLGYAASSMLGFAVAYVRLVRLLDRLPYRVLMPPHSRA